MSVPEQPTSTVVVEDPEITVVEVLADGSVVIEETPDPDVVEVGIMGPQGPRGLPGTGGGGSTLEDPHMEALLAANLGPGGNADLDASAITTGKVGQLWGVDCGASVPLRIDVQTINGSRITQTTIYTEGGETDPWRSPDPKFIVLDGDGSAAFGVSVTNLSAYQQADARVTIYWDEVTP